MIRTNCKPTVSIGLPVFNGQNFLELALEAITAQTYENFEVIVSDNGSNDDTEIICRKFVERDSRIKYFRHEVNRGAAPNFNFTFEKATGKYFKWAAHDDVMLPHYLELCIAAFEASEQCKQRPSIVYPRSVFIDDNDSIIGPDDDRTQTNASSSVARGLHAIDKMNLAGPVFGLIRSEILAKTRLIDSFIASDYVLIFECALYGPIVQLNDVHSHRRVHAKGSRQANITKTDVLKWFDPNAKQRLTSRQKLFIEYQRSIWRLDGLSFFDRLLLSIGLSALTPIRRIRVHIGKFRRKVLKTF